MAEASLAFPTVCLILSGLFLLSVYNVSIRACLHAFYRHTVDPVYQQARHKITNRNPQARNLADQIPEARYEPINADTHRREEQHPSSVARPLVHHTYHLPDEGPAFRDPSLFPEPSTNINHPRGSILYASGPNRPLSQEDYGGLFPSNTYSSPPSSPDSDIFEGEYDTDWSNSAADETVLESYSDVDDIPVWEFDIQREVFIVDETHPEESVGWVDEILEWAAEGVFAMVVPEIPAQRE